MYIAGMVAAFVSDLGIRVRRLRDDLGWSQEQLARAASRKGEASVSRGWLSQVESGEIAKPRADLLNQLARALNTTVDYLLNGAPPEGATVIVPEAMHPMVIEIREDPTLWPQLQAVWWALRDSARADQRRAARIRRGRRKSTD